MSVAYFAVRRAFRLFRCVTGRAEWSLGRYQVVVSKTLVIFAALLIAGCSQNITMPAEDQGNWLRIERRAVLPGGHAVYAACDKVTGNLLYLMAGDGRAVAVVPGACK